MQPAKLADFKLASALGAGLTSKVYDAVHIATGQPVVVKVLEPSQSGSEMRERFAREAVLLAGVASRHVRNIVGFGFERGQPFLVLERLRGETLDAKLRRDGPVPLAAGLRWFEQLLVGVRDCHDQQIIHRDIKPSNIFLHLDGGEETVKLIDFGVARIREVTGEEEGLTSKNDLIGSMGYMPPEQLSNAKTVDFRADLYAVGVCVFRALTGRLPFVSRSLGAAIKIKSEQAVPPVSTMPGMPRNALLDSFADKSMARAAGDRFQSAREMLERWRIVVASLEEGDATEIMRGVRRADASHAAPLQRSMQGAVVPGAVLPHAPASPASAVSAADIDDVTTLRRNVSSVLDAATQPLAPPLSVRHAPDTIGEVTLHDASPNTEPSPTLGLGAGADEDAAMLDDPFDVPTRSDPNLRRLVEAELELHRRRKGQPR